MRRRKHLTVREVVESANKLLADSHPDVTREREGVAHFIASLLHRTGNYNGFSYLPSAGLTGAGTIDVKVADESRISYSLPRD